MFIRFVSTLIVLAGLHSTASAKEAQLYVSTVGNDTWSGTLSAPSDDKSDGPFATLERARDEIRKWKTRTGRLPSKITIYVRGGDYDRDVPFELNKPDSGSEQMPIVYRAYEGERVRLIGGKRVTNWQPVADKAILDRLDETARKKVVQADLNKLGVKDFGKVARAAERLELFFDDEPMQLSRWPNKDFTHIKEVVGGKPKKVHGLTGDEVGRFTYEGDRPKRWGGEDEIWLHGYWFWDWSDAYQKVESIDTDGRVIQLVKPYHHYGYRNGQRYYAINLLAELDTPGEWYLDRKTGILYFWPPKDIKTAEAFVSTLDTIILADDASHITVADVTIGFNRGTAIKIERGRHFQVARCTLANVGGNGVQVRSGESHQVIDCDIYNLGDSGISLTGGDRKTLTPANHAAINNHIHHYSRTSNTYRTAVNVHGVGHRVAHNLIHDAPHMALGLSGNDHVIEFNEVHHVCMITDDAGAFYMGRDWTWRSNIIRYNYFHHIGDFKSHVGTQAIYLDDWASDTEVYGNIVHKAYRAILVGGGRDNIVDNNILIDCEIGVHVDARGLGWAKYYFDGTTTTLTDRLEKVPYKEPPWSERYPELLTLYDDEAATPKYNRVTRNIAFNCKKWLDLRMPKELVDRGVVTVEDNLTHTDPLFVDAANSDFRLKKDSPAWKLGFKPIPVEKIGLQRGASMSARSAR